jgi:hypothetical protein
VRYDATPTRRPAVLGSSVPAIDVFVYGTLTDSARAGVVLDEFACRDRGSQ